MVATSKRLEGRKTNYSNLQKKIDDWFFWKMSAEI